MLIVLEGLDGAGKSTQVKLLKEYLIRKGVNLRYLHFPRYEAPLYGELIGKYLRGDFGAIEQVHPQIVALLFALDQTDAAGQIRSWLDAGDCVLLDRYVYSNIAYQCAKMKMQAASQEEGERQALELRRWIIDTEFVKGRVPRPDLSLFLDVPIDFVDARLKESRSDASDREYLQGKEDIHEADIRFQRCVRERYREEARLNAGFRKVCCEDGQGRMLAPERIFDHIRAFVDPMFR